MTAPVQFLNVSKRYRQGAIHHSLRDAIPAMLKGWMHPKQRDELGEGEFWALKNVSFEVAKGEMLGIIGRNGAGKSTTLKLLSGITKQTKGEIRLEGRLAALIEVGAGFHPDLTGRENVYLNGTILGLKRQEIKALFDRIVAFAEIEPFIDTPVKRYSSGMYVRLGFAIAAYVDPDVLLIDEVLAVGDMAFQQKCMQRIHELKRAGKTMIFISHNLNAIQRICDRALLLTAGEVTARGHVAEVIRVYREQVIEKERKRFAKSVGRKTPEAAAMDTGVKIESVQLRDGEGRVIETVSTGVPLTVDIRYHCARRIERPIVNVSIDRLDGLLCHVATTRGAKAVPPLEGRGALRLTYPRLPLLPNTYGVSVEITEEQRVVPLESRKFVSMFTITSTDHESGIVRLDHHWDWDPAT